MFYGGDNWKIKPNFTLSVGLRYDRDTGRTDSDLPADANINGAFPGYGILEPEAGPMARSERHPIV